MKGFFLYSKLWEETVKKEYVVGIWCIVVGVVLFVVFSMYVGKGKVNSSSDMVITNTYQVKDISKNKMIQEEGRQRLIAMMAERSLKPDGEIDFVRVIDYKAFGNHHYLFLEFKTKIVGKPKEAKAAVYLDVEENKGQYTVVHDYFCLSTFPESDEKFKEAYATLMNLVVTCGGTLPDPTTK